MKHIKFDGFNFKEVDGFIKGIECYNNDFIQLNHSEGEIKFNGHYYKAPCYIIVSELTEELIVLPESFVSYIGGSIPL